MRSFFIFILFFSSTVIFSNTTNAFVIVDDTTNYTQVNKLNTDSSYIEIKNTRYFTSKRFTAIALAILTGPLGGHRIYLGSHPVVPVFYAITLGGGFIVLPVIDLISIIFTKDLSKFENNERVIMWLNADKETEHEIENR